MGVTVGGYVSLGGTDRSSLCEGWEAQFEVRVEESTPLDSDAVARDAGLKDNRFTLTIVDDDSLTLTQYLFTNRGTKIAFELRADDASVSATNPKYTGNIVCPAPPVSAINGQSRRYTLNCMVDGDVTQATS